MKLQSMILLIIKFSFINCIIKILPDFLNAPKLEEIRIKQPTIKQVKRNLWYSLAGLCSDQYLKNWDCKLCDRVSNTTFIKSFSNLLFEVRGFIAIDHHEKNIVLVFRCTDGLSNFLDDLTLLTTSFDELGDPSIRVHLGFYRSMNAISKDFLNTLDNLFKNPKYKDHNLKLVGYSLGGSMASLAMLRIQKHFDYPWERISLFTYGQPRTGNTGFAKYVNNKPITLARAVEWLDPVPRYPPRLLLDYTHFGNEVFLTSDKYKFCSNVEFEDTECGSGVPRFITNPLTHFDYFGVFMDRDKC